MSQQHREEISRRLRPIAPPRVVDGVMRAEQVATVMDLIRRHEPWDLILKHHFRSLEELVATTSGGRPLGPKARSRRRSGSPRRSGTAASSCRTPRCSTAASRTARPSGA